MALNDWQDGVAGGTPLSAARLNERDQAILDLESVVEGKADVSHTHAAGDITGTLAAARIPNLAQSKVTGLEARLDAIESRLDSLETE